MRVDQSWRGVVVRLGEARYALLRVLPHDDAINWAARQRFGVNPATGLVEILDVPTVEAKIEAVVSSAPPEATRLFANCRDRDFTAVGVDQELIPLLRRIVDEAELYAIANYLPDAQSDAVLLLADGKSAEEVWAELSQDYELGGDRVDVDDIDRALEQPGTRSGFVVTTSDAELVELLSGDFEAWRTFLHPTQRAMAYRPAYKGPAKVTGGAGTGKTVVAIHRARYLAQRLLEAGNSTSRILFATYTNSLADNLDQTLRTFCTPDEYRRLHVSTVDAFARQTLSAARSQLRPVQDDALRDLADQSATMAGLDEHGLDGRFLDRGMGAGHPGSSADEPRRVRDEPASWTRWETDPPSTKGRVVGARTLAVRPATTGTGNIPAVGGQRRRPLIDATRPAVRSPRCRRGPGPAPIPVEAASCSSASG